MPLAFPAHQGLILPVARKWPGRFDVLALSIGAAMPDISDSVLGFLVNGYFKQWHGHSLMGIIAFDIPGGLLLTWMVTVLAARLLKTNASHGWQTRLRLWSFSITIGVLSHLGFDLISHTTNLLLHPWWSNVQWFPRWWYAAWFEFHPLSIFDPSYTAGPHTVVWCVLSLVGSLYFCRSLNPKKGWIPLRPLPFRPEEKSKSTVLVE